MSLFAWLNPSRWLLMLACAGALALGYVAWADHQQGIGESRATARYNAAIERQKAAAALLLADARATALQAQADLAALTLNLEKKREVDQLKNADGLRVRLAGQRLQFATQDAGCGRGGDAAQVATAGAAGDAGTTVVQLPEPISRALFEFATDAESLAIDYRTLFEFAHNPALVCELAK